MEPLSPGSPSHHAGYQPLLPNPTPANLETRVTLLAKGEYCHFPRIILQQETLARDIRKGMGSDSNVYSIPAGSSWRLGSSNVKASWYLYVDPPKDHKTSHETRVDDLIYNIVLNQLSYSLKQFPYGMRPKRGELMHIYGIRRRPANNGFIYSLGSHIVIHFPSCSSPSEKFVEAHRILLIDEPLRKPPAIPVAAVNRGQGAAKSHEQKFAATVNAQQQDEFWQRRYANLPPLCPQPAPGPQPKPSVQRSPDSHPALPVGNAQEHNKPKFTTVVTAQQQDEFWQRRYADLPLLRPRPALKGRNAEEHNKLLTQLKNLILWVPGNIGQSSDTGPARRTLLDLLKNLSRSTDTTKHLQVIDSLKKLWSAYEDSHDTTYLGYLKDLHVQLIESCTNCQTLALEIVHIWLTRTGLNAFAYSECFIALMGLLYRLPSHWKMGGPAQPAILSTILDLLVRDGTLHTLNDLQRDNLFGAWPALGQMIRR